MTEPAIRDARTLPAVKLCAGVRRIAASWSKTRKVKGPITAMLRSLDFLGWKLTSTVATHTGDELVMNVGTPKMLVKLMEKRLIQQHEEAVQQRIRNHGWAPPEETKQLEGLDMGLQAMRKAMKQPSTTTAQQRILVQLLAQAYPDGGTFRVRGDTKRQGCPFCGQAGPDTTPHRVWGCDDLHQEREQTVKTDVMQWGQRSGGDTMLDRFACGIRKLRPNEEVGPIK